MAPSSRPISRQVSAVSRSRITEAAKKAGYEIRVVDYDLSWIAGASALADHYEGRARAVIVSCLDNLLKGASSQAVQNLNVMLGWNEPEGLE